MAETRWLDDHEQHAWRAYLRMNTVLGAALSRQMQTESMLSMQDFEVLVHLTDVDDARLRVSELARAMRWEKSRLSHHLSRMEKRGLIGREECTSDGRGAFIVLTPEGRAAIEAAAPSHVDAVRRHFFDILTDDDVDALTSIAGRVIARVEATDVCPSE
ncbi:MarR family winged helix-turn-helix transcriptional regulator [Jiangella rhizosphaerae]|uniref:MarR family transcriptional regulator n=1 Tax=Jiangella rhizosphaerae TaxID=2293569 RepID=A0A418KSD3_9ACTN|nr:MarR family transcriptional regulator [Jiangella rhizosphaerae]RIQ26252.1 MarR family transcriptional regulator [Jiangella rhizosphaerae]